MFRDSLRNAQGHATRLFGHVRTAATHVHRTLGMVERVYQTIAPAFAPLAIEHFGAERAHQIHGAVSSGFQHGQRLTNAIQYP